MALVRVTRRTTAYDAATRATTVTVEAVVGQPPAALAPMVDPQCWSRCSPFFRESYKVRREDYARDVAPPPGTPWRGYLYEHFQVPVATFENILGIDFDVTPDAVDLEYWLHDSVRCLLVGLELPGVLEVDAGYMRVRPAAREPGSSEVYMQKTVVFADLTRTDRGSLRHGQWLNHTAPAALNAWVDASTLFSFATPPEDGAR